VVIATLPLLPLRANFGYTMPPLPKRQAMPQRVFSAPRDWMVGLLFYHAL